MWLKPPQLYFPALSSPNLAAFGPSRPTQDETDSPSPEPLLTCGICYQSAGLFMGTLYAVTEHRNFMWSQLLEGLISLAHWDPAARSWFSEGNQNSSSQNSPLTPSLSTNPRSSTWPLSGPQQGWFFPGFSCGSWEAPGQDHHLIQPSSTQSTHTTELHTYHYQVWKLFD